MDELTTGVDPTVAGDVVPRAAGATLSAADVRGLLNQVAECYPDTAQVMDAAQRLIVHLESLRHEALLPLSLGRAEGVERLLKRPASVEVHHAH